MFNERCTEAWLQDRTLKKKNKRETGFMLYILLTSYNTALGTGVRSGRRG